MLKKIIAILLVVASSTATFRSTAGAAEPAKPRPPSDVGVGAAQLALGTGVALASAFVASNVLSGDDDVDVLAGSLLLGAAATGLTVCAVGLASTASEGGCREAIVGSAIGGLMAFPIALVTGPEDGGLLYLLGWYVVGSATVATIGWHAGKRPRLAAQPAALPPSAPAITPASLSSRADEWPELRRRPWAGAKEAGFKLTVPIVALTF